MKVTREELVTTSIERFTDLLRIEKAVDREKEIAVQKAELIAKLESLGVVIDKISATL